MAGPSGDRDPHRYTDGHSQGHSHGHDHGDHHGHHHGAEHVDSSTPERRVLIALVLTASFMMAELVGGLLTGSLALLADAGHMLTDAAALALAWAAFRVARRPNDTKRTYGYHRIQVLSAFVNGVSLVVIVGWIAIEAVRRMFQPIEILGGPMLVIAVLGLFVNIAAFLVLRGGGNSLNIRGAALHVLGDLLGSVAAILAAIIMLTTGWTPIDPILSLLVAALILRSAWSLVRQSAHILLEGAPAWLDIDTLRADLRGAVPDLEDVHHVHAWMLTDERPLVTLHARLRPGADAQNALLSIHRQLADRFGVGHATVQIEPTGCADDLLRAEMRAEMRAESQDGAQGSEPAGRDHAAEGHESESPGPKDRGAIAPAIPDP